MRCSRASTSRSSKVVSVPGSRSIRAQDGRSGASVGEVQGWSSSAASFASQARVARWSVTTYEVVCSGPASGLAQRGDPVGSVVGDLLLPEPPGAGAVRVPVEVDRPVVQVGQEVRGDAHHVADQVALGHGWLVAATREEHLVDVGQSHRAALELPGAARLGRPVRPARRRSAGPRSARRRFGSKLRPAWPGPRRWCGRT